MSNKLLGDLLIKKGCITQEQLMEALKESAGQEDMLGRVLVNKGLIKEDDLLKVLSEKFNIPYLSLIHI